MPTSDSLDRGEPPARLATRTLRSAWTVMATVLLSLFVASLVPYADQAARFDGPHQPPATSILPGLEALGWSVETYVTVIVALRVGFAAAFLGVAALIFTRGPRDRGSLAASLVLLAFGVSFPNTLDALSHERPALRSLVNLVGDISFAAFFVLVYVFPTGTFVPRWTAPLAAALVTMLVGSALLPGSWMDQNAWPVTVQVPVFVLLFGSMIVAQVWRYRFAATPEQRRKIRWVVAGFASSVGGFLLLSLLPGWREAGAGGAAAYLAQQVGLTVVFLLVPATFLAAMLRDGLYDVNLAVSRALVWSALTAFVVGVYSLVVGGLGALLQVRAPFALGVLASALVAVAFEPLRRGVQRAVNRVVFGDRDDPYEALTRLNGRLGAVIAPEDVLPSVTRGVAEALRLPYVAVRLSGNVREAELGTRPPNVVDFPLVSQGALVGTLSVGTRTPDEELDERDRRLLEDLARHAGPAVHAAGLVLDLRASRERLVEAREEERRRLRRDLHDGLGPVLAGIAMRADVTRTLVTRDPARADAVLLDLKATAQDAVADVRRLVYALRPPALDDLGLFGALRQLADRQVNVEVAVTLPDTPPDLPAAVEVAVLRVAQEALHNVAVHADARTCTMSVRVTEDAVTLVVLDDGRGLPGTLTRGVGLTSMRERADELGGTLHLDSPPGGGTRVTASFPRRLERGTSA